eukprot:465191_1
MVEYSTVASISYFTLNVIFLLLLAVWVYKSGGHNKITSTSYIKDLWCLRKILAPAIVNFYDTATDIGVIWYWGELMKMEQNNERDFNTLNMAVFFWSGLAFVLIYRLLMLLGAIITGWCGYDDDNTKWYDPILVLFDVYILKFVYISFKEAKPALEAKREKRRKKSEGKKLQKEVEMQMETNKTAEKKASDAGTTKNVKDDETADEETIEPVETQTILLALEAVMESMPQIVLQSVFLIRSANDDYLKIEGSNDLLMILSIIASLISISNKYAAQYDAEFFRDGADSLKPRLAFPDCIQYWYALRTIWRNCDLISRFTVFVLIWTVMGGAWLCIWCSLIYIYWVFIVYFVNDEGGKSLLLGFVLLVGVCGPPLFHGMKYIESVIGLSLIMVFSSIEFECWNCANASTRQFTNPQNNRILIFLCMGWTTFVIEIISYVAIVCNGMMELNFN